MDSAMASRLILYISRAPSRAQQYLLSLLWVLFTLLGAALVITLGLLFLGFTLALGLLAALFSALLLPFLPRDWRRP